MKDELERFSALFAALTNFFCRGGSLRVVLGSARKEGCGVGESIYRVAKLKSGPEDWADSAQRARSENLLRGTCNNQK